VSVLPTLKSPAPDIYETVARGACDGVPNTWLFGPTEEKQSFKTAWLAFKAKHGEAALAAAYRAMRC
jgi:hypothetical protein